jgi:hypothetical protein
MGHWHDPSWRPGGLWRDELRERRLRQLAHIATMERRGRAVQLAARVFVGVAVSALLALAFAASQC